VGARRAVDQFFPQVQERRVAQCVVKSQENAGGLRVAISKTQKIIDHALGYLKVLE
jgi:hypothetical protein